MPTGLFAGLSNMDVAFLCILILAAIAAVGSATIFLASAKWSAGCHRRDQQRRGASIPLPPTRD